MIISNATAATVSVSRAKTASPVGSAQPVDGFGPEYQLELSSQSRAQGLALNQMATGITETKMRNVLTRILLETLFGSGEMKPSETPEEELVREVAQEPVMEESLRQMTS